MLHLGELIGQIKLSGSPDDSILPRLLKEAFPTLAQYIVHIINGSLASGIVPDHLKHAVVQPPLKKPDLDSSILTHFRPISKLEPFFQP